MRSSMRARTRALGGGLVVAGFAVMLMAPTALATSKITIGDDTYGGGDTTTTTEVEEPTSTTDGEEPTTTTEVEDTTTTTECEYGDGDCTTATTVTVDTQGEPPTTVVDVVATTAGDGQPGAEAAAGGGTLPRTGSSSMPLGLAGFGSVVAGLALLATMRRRPVPAR